MRLKHLLILGLLVQSSGQAQEAGGEAPAFTPEAIHFFETSVRPVLVENCYECHGPDKSHAALRVDSREALLKGGDQGAVISLEQPGNSRLIKALRHHEGVPAMPKKKPALPASQIDAIERWIAGGMAWPKEVASASEASKKEHWAFQPPKAPPVPQVEDPAWKKHPVDAFLYDLWKKEGIQPAPLAKTSVWQQRAWHVLTGLLPSKEEANLPVESEEAWSEQVHQLLQRPAFGERMARRWMDVARYSDTKGYLAGDVDMNLPFSFSYRDWLVEAFNRDLSYQDFVRLQLAADRMREIKDGEKDLAALGFLTVSRRDGNRQEILDDWIDATTRGLLGLTVACARCHDHKTDPVSAADYYALYGVFNNANEPDPMEMPVVSEVPPGPERDEFQKQLQEAQSDLAAYYQSVEDHIRNPEFMAAYLEYSISARDWDDGKLSGILGDRTKADIEKDKEKNKHLRYRIRLMRGWQGWIQKHSGDQNEKILGLWQAIAKLPGEGFEHAMRELAEKAKIQEGSPLFSRAFAEALLNSGAKTLSEAASVLANLLLEADRSPEEDEKFKELRQLVRQGDSPLNWRGEEVHRVFDTTDNNQRTQRRNKITRLLSSHAGAPARAMIVKDRPQMEEAVIFRRGNPGMRGDRVPRRWLSHFGGDAFPADQSGRRELAEKIVSRDNPLTARVWVNRVWAHVFGTPLVDNVSDFGVQTPVPRHLALLDHLAVWFMDHEWSTKKLMHYLVTMRAFRLESDVSEAVQGNLAKDAANATYWRGNRRRLEFESLRDRFLTATGELKVEHPTPGRSVRWDQPESDHKRSLYLVNDRYMPYEVARIFDQPVGEQHTPIRYETAVPQQMLFFLNSQFVQTRAQKLVQSPEFQSYLAAGNQEGAIRWLFERVLAREVTPEELQMAKRFIEEGTEEAHGPRAGNWKYESARSMQLEDGKFAIQDVEPLKHYIESSRQWKLADLPEGNPNFYLGLYPGSGHPGEDRAPILTWLPEVDGPVKAKIRVKVPSEKSDGLWVLWYSGDQQLAAHHVKPKEEWADESITFDAVKGTPVRVAFSPGKSQAHDSFQWSLSYHSPEGEILADASKDFRDSEGIPLSWTKRRVPWADLVQAIFASNEFSYVD